MLAKLSAEVAKRASSGLFASSAAGPSIVHETRRLYHERVRALSPLRAAFGPKPTTWPSLHGTPHSQFSRATPHGRPLGRRDMSCELPPNITKKPPPLARARRGGVLPQERVPPRSLRMGVAVYF